MLTRTADGERAWSLCHDCGGLTDGARYCTACEEMTRCVVINGTAYARPQEPNEERWLWSMECCEVEGCGATYGRATVAGLVCGGCGKLYPWRQMQARLCVW